jgi:DNA-binding MarR family transcriptional regulator
MALQETPVRTLDELICFDLYAASRAVTALYRPLLEPLGLTYPQYLVLTALQPGEPVSVRDVGQSLELDHGTLTPLLRRMEASGLLTRTRSRDDERRVDVELTDEGEALRGRFDEVQCVVAEGMGLTTAQVHDLQTTLRTLTLSARERATSEVSDR